PSPERMIVFLQKLLKAPPRDLLLILDNLKVYEAKVVRQWLEENANRSDVFSLPPCYRELSPFEYCNGNLKRDIQCGVPPPDLGELTPPMLGISRRGQKKLRRVRANAKHRNSIYVAKLHCNWAGSTAGTRVP
ncbi:MAG: hypothetical protein GJU76_11435, partial [Gallionella sp.]|nr:hypothetical protein [Gallionella sp.]